MTSADLHGVLERAGDQAPRVDPAAIARRAQVGAVRRRRRLGVVVPASAVVAAVVVAGTFARLDDAQKAQKAQRDAPAGRVIAPTAHSVDASFTCCTDADFHQPAHPGSTFLIHWIRVGTGEAKVQMEATLNGPFESLEQLKSGNTGRSTYSDLQGANTTSPAPVSTIAISRDAQPGLYNLVIKVQTTDARTKALWEASGSSVVTITK